MSDARLLFALKLSLLTAVTLVGGTALGFLVDPSGLGNLLRQLPSNLRNPMEIIGLVGPLFLGGALWGLGIARLTGADAKSLSLRVALIWSVSMTAMAWLVHSTPYFISLRSLPGAFPLDVHGFFTFVFVAAVGIVAAINSAGVAYSLGLVKRLGAVTINSGLAAALGFLVVSLVSRVGGWEVTNQSGFVMFWLMLAGMIAAAATGGAAMGWTLYLEVRNPASESDPHNNSLERTPPASA